MGKNVGLIKVKLVSFVEDKMLVALESHLYFLYFTQRRRRALVSINNFHCTRAFLLHCFFHEITVLFCGVP